MSRVRLTLAVAQWEFRRFFKLKEQAITLLLFVLGGAGMYGFGAMRERAERRPVHLAVVGAHQLALPAGETGRIRLQPHAATAVDSLRAAVGAKTLDGLLVIDDSDNARLVVRQRSKWIPQVQRLLHDARRDAELRALGLQPEVLEQLLAEPELAVEFHEAGGRAASRASPATAIVFLVLVMVAIYLGNAYLFVGITGEKQQRITEQVLSAIAPQTWIDGKILGLAGVAIASLAVTVLGFVVFSVVPVLLEATLGHGDVAVELAAASAGAGGDPSGTAQASRAARNAWMQKLPDPGFVAIAGVLAALGFAFWFIFFAAIAATITDAHLSNRGTFLMLPMVPVALAFVGVGEPDGGFARVWSLLPFSAFAGMPVRMSLTPVAWWEIAVAMLGTGLSAAALRRLAGKIFAVGMLMHGKEPSWREVMRWMKQA